MNQEKDSPFQGWEEIVRNSFLTTLEAAKYIKPGTPEWDCVWHCLQGYKLYAERNHEYEKMTTAPKNKDDHKMMPLMEWEVDMILEALEYHTFLLADKMDSKNYFKCHDLILRCKLEKQKHFVSSQKHRFMMF